MGRAPGESRFLTAKAVRNDKTFGLHKREGGARTTAGFYKPLPCCAEMRASNFSCAFNGWV